MFVCLFVFSTVLFWELYFIFLCYVIRLPTPFFQKTAPKLQCVVRSTENVAHILTPANQPLFLSQTCWQKYGVLSTLLKMRQLFALKRKTTSHSIELFKCWLTLTLRNFSENQYNINEETISTFKARLAISLVSTMANIWNEFVLVLMNKISPFRAQNIITKTSLTRNVFTLLLAIN